MKMHGVICLLAIHISIAVCQPVGNTDYVASAPAPSEDAASTSSTIQNLSQQARNGPPGFTTCKFNMQGGCWHFLCLRASLDVSRFEGSNR